MWFAKAESEVEIKKISEELPPVTPSGDVESELVPLHSTPTVASVGTGTTHGLIHEGSLTAETINENDDTDIEMGGEDVVTNGSDASGRFRRAQIERSRNESWKRTMLTILIPFLIAGLGLVLTGYLLDQYIETIVSFVELKEIRLLVTPLLGLKGNLEMTLAARLCTLVNMGKLNSCSRKVNCGLADLALSQVQSVVVGLLASLICILLFSLQMGWADYDFSIHNVFVICASSILTASLASFVLGVLMIAIVFGSDWVNINPDNISTPIAAAAGDIVTLNLLAWTSNLLYIATVHEDFELTWISPLIIVSYFIILGVFGYISYKNAHTKKTLIDCWLPLIVALTISSVAGLIFEYEDGRFHNLSLYQPVINGIGGNLAAVQYNRLSTAYNRDGKLGDLPEVAPGAPKKVFLTPADTFFRFGTHSVTAWILLALAVPGHAIFATIIIVISHDHDCSCYQYFIFMYLLACFTQVATLLWLTPILTNFLWKRSIDPDSYVIPLLTSTGDVLGTLLLAIVFESVYNGGCVSGRETHTAGHHNSTNLC